MIIHGYRGEQSHGSPKTIDGNYCCLVRIDIEWLLCRRFIFLITFSSELMFKLVTVPWASASAAAKQKAAGREGATNEEISVATDNPQSG